jgi:hypothetical protein
VVEFGGFALFAVFVRIALFLQAQRLGFFKLKYTIVVISSFFISIIGPGLSNNCCNILAGGLLCPNPRA